MKDEFPSRAFYLYLVLDSFLAPSYYACVLIQPTMQSYIL
jgi:hypothetical protein